MSVKIGVFVFSAITVSLLIHGVIAASTSIQITDNFVENYIGGQNLSGDVVISFTEALPENPVLKAHVDGVLKDSFDLTDMLPTTFPYMTYNFDYGITAGFQRSWTDYPEQSFTYFLMVNGTCGDQDCAELGSCSCPCTVPDSDPYECGWDVFYHDGVDTITGQGLEEIYNGEYLQLPLDNNEHDTGWYIKCRDGDYHESCDQALGTDGENVKLTTRDSCIGTTSTSLIWEEKTLPSGSVCTDVIYSTPQYTCNGISDNYTTLSFDNDSLNPGFKRYGGPDKPEGGGIYKDGIYQTSGQSVFWDSGWFEEDNTGIIVIRNWNPTASYTIAYLPHNGPYLCAYTDYSEPRVETDMQSKLAGSGQCKYDAPYTKTFEQYDLDVLFNDIPDCSGIYSCEMLSYSVVDNDPSDVVDIAADSATAPITVTASTDSTELSYEYTISGIELDDLEITAPDDEGVHTLTLKVDSGATTLATKSKSFSTCPDGDGDGYCGILDGGDDCNDNDPEAYPGAPEFCDDVDNDCDENVDEGFLVGENCGKEGICDGVFVCSETGLNVTCDNTVGPGDLGEICDDGVDNDCDGIIDEDGYTIDGVWQDCTTICEEAEESECGTNIGICDKGYQICLNSEWSMCIGGKSPCGGTWDNPLDSCTDACNGIDDDCDGTVDNVNGGESVAATKCGCYDGGSPRAENVDACNDIDDDCDGLIDEGLVCCSPGETRQCGTAIGVCEFGIQTCTSDGKWQGASCVGGVQPSAEVCYDNDDNNCNGDVDEYCNPAITCHNEKQDLNEWGVDCGGPCEKECENFMSWLMIAAVMIIVILGFVITQIRK